MTFTHASYRVTWICALPSELAATKLFLDEVHPRLTQPESDHNIYTLGSVSGHNIVVACLPAGVYGTNSAAAAVAYLKSTYPNIIFGLMVGIGGGVPRDNVDIRLGDIVVSKPTNSFPGVIQYDYGKTLQSGQFNRLGSLNKPPQVLLKAIAQVESDYMLGNLSLNDTMASKLQKKEVQERFSRPSKDWLFHPTYNHIGDRPDCSACDKNQLVNRPERTAEEPHIHCGLIASGNQVMRDASTRDLIAQELNILCFEMEAAGLMDEVPSLVIRGICDYCDSHKHKDWQEYAALSAAAYAKELLERVPISDTITTTKTLMVTKSSSFQSLNTDPSFQKESSASSLTYCSVVQHECSDPSIDIPEYPKRTVVDNGKSLSEETHERLKGSCGMINSGGICQCDCHREHRLRFPPLGTPALGIFFLRYKGTSLFRRKCSVNSCRNNKPGFFDAIYCFPNWLVDVTLVISGGPSKGLFLPRRLGWDTAETILKCAYEDNVEGMKVLLSNSAYALHDIDRKHGRTALHYAVMHNHIKACEFLRNASANAHAMDYTGMTPTTKAWEHILTRRGAPCQLESLKRLFPDIELCDDMGFSHIHLLVVGILSGGLAESLQIKTYLRQIDSRDFSGRSPLHWAATRGDFDCIRILLRFGANAKVVDDTDSTPLMFAASSGCSRSLKLLLGAESDVHAKNIHGSTALYYACRHQHRLPAVVLLHQSGAHLDTQNKNGHTPLIGAAIRNHVEIGRYFLSQGADINIRGAHGESALFEAIFHKSHQFIRLLLENSADYTIVSNSGSTILHAAALEGDCETLHILLHAGLGRLDPYHRNKDNLTAKEMVLKRSIIPEGFEDIFDRLVSEIAEFKQY